MTRPAAIFLLCLLGLSPALAAAADAPAETPTPAASRKDDSDASDYPCNRDCDIFRRECLSYCKQQGRIPGARGESEDCAGDCQQFESDGLDSCDSEVWRRAPMFPSRRR